MVKFAMGRYRAGSALLWSAGNTDKIWKMWPGGMEQVFCIWDRPLALFPWCRHLAANLPNPAKSTKICNRKLKKKPWILLKALWRINLKGFSPFFFLTQMVPYLFRGLSKSQQSHSCLKQNATWKKPLRIHFFFFLLPMLEKALNI